MPNRNKNQDKNTLNRCTERFRKFVHVQSNLMQYWPVIKKESHRFTVSIKANIADQISMYMYVCNQKTKQKKTSVLHC